MNSAVQIHCPFCNATQALSSGGQYTCEFCLQPFSVVQAEKEESRLVEEIKNWVNSKVGASGVSAGMDVASRAFIFQQKILPDLKREVDRSLELLGNFARHPLLFVPTPWGGNNPIDGSRNDILAFKSLRARMSSESVTAFAVGASEQASITGMDERLAIIMHMSNFVGAAKEGTAAGYSAARRNLDALIATTDAVLARKPTGDPGMVPFLSAQKQRYSALSEACRACEEVVGAASLVGTPIAERLAGLAEQLAEASKQMEASNCNDPDTMPSAIAANSEGTICLRLGAWLRAYDALCRRPVPFPEFVRSVEAIFPAGGTPNDQGALLEAFTAFVRAVRGEEAVGVLSDFSWVAAWTEQSRMKKFLGLFGTEESVAGADEFLLPVWLADVTFSKTEGAVFKEGVEQRCLAAVDACTPSAEKVIILDGPASTVAAALANPQPLGTANAALPRSSAAGVSGIVAGAIRNRPNMHNPKVSVRGLAFVSAAVVRYESKKGPRDLAACQAGLIPTDTAARAQWQSAQQFLAQLG